MMEAISSPEKSVSARVTRRNIPGDGILYTSPSKHAEIECLQFLMQKTELDSAIGWIPYQAEEKIFLPK
jgi:hypothetical protein